MQKITTNDGSQIYIMKIGNTDQLRVMIDSDVLKRFNTAFPTPEEKKINISAAIEYYLDQREAGKIEVAKKL